ncbi:DUF58 domain-containing protein [Leucobacter sp. NPDC077196]|uniref:DUF58 domain-containing protein n=1 Tax=Leucobacter sp. NPDC077196 TaxID=3154959 RepID=UPI0034341332
MRAARVAAARPSDSGSDWSVTLTARGWACTIAAFALGVSWYAVGLRDVWYLAWLLGALVVVALVCAVVGGLLAGFEVRVRVDEPAPFIGSIVHCTATISHRLPMSTRARAVWVAADQRAAPTLDVPRDATAVSAFEWQATARGPHKVRVATVGIVDPLGLARYDVGARATAPAIVLPRGIPGLTALLDAESTNRLGGDAGPAASGGGEGAVGGGALREYRRGDAPRQINWKQSARQGEWLVNLPEPATRSERALRLDCDADAYRSAADFEIAVSAAATIVGHWARFGHVIELQLASAPAVVSDAIDPLLRALAGAQLRATAASLPAAQPSLPGVVVTGTVHERLRHELELAPEGGAIFVLHPLPRAIPNAWRSQQIPVIA